MKGWRHQLAILHKNGSHIKFNWTVGSSSSYFYCCDVAVGTQNIFKLSEICIAATAFVNLKVVLDFNFQSHLTICLIKTQGQWVLASLASQCCVLEQDTIILALYWFDLGRPIPS